MSEDRPITPEQAMLAVKAAGLDPDKPLNEQLEENQDGVLKRQVAELSEQVRVLSDSGANQDPHTRERRFAEDFRDALNENLTPWFGEETDDAA